MSVKSKKRPGQRSANRNSEMIDKMRTFLKSGRRLTIREMSEEVGMSIISYHANVTEELVMKRVATNFVCRTKGESLACSHWIASVRRIRRVLFKKLYHWLRNMDLRILKQRSSHRPSSPRPKKSHPVRSKPKCLLAMFLYQDGDVHHEFSPEGQISNNEYYLQVRRRLRYAVRCKGPEKSCPQGTGKSTTTHRQLTRLSLCGIS